MALPQGTTGSLDPRFRSAWLVSLTVKLACALTLHTRLPSVLSKPLNASVTFWEATAPVKLPAWHCFQLRGHGLESQQPKGGIPPMTPPRLASRLQSLPPMLHMDGQDPMPSYSKGSRGLFVQSRVGGIFTATTSSPSTPSRRRFTRYAIRAGRNLPDKEFRYLRTVRVTAAVCRGFGRKLRPPKRSDPLP